MGGRTKREAIRRPGRPVAAAALLACAIATPALASDARLSDDLEALMPPTRTVCYVGRPDDPLVARLRLFRLEDAWAVVPDETGPDRGVGARLDLTPKPGMDPEGSPAGSPLAGRAYCSAAPKLGAISCSDDSGCDRADRLRIERTASGMRVTFRDLFAFAGVGCGGLDDDEAEPPGLELPDPRARSRTFELVRRPVEECR